MHKLKVVYIISDRDVSAVLQDSSVYRKERVYV